MRQADDTIQDPVGFGGKFGDIVMSNNKSTRGQQRLYQPAATVTANKNFFLKTIREWNLLPTSVTDAATLEVF